MMLAAGIDEAGAHVIRDALAVRHQHLREQARAERAMRSASK